MDLIRSVLKLVKKKYGVDYPCLTKNALNRGNIISEINKKFAELLASNDLKYEMEYVLEGFSYDFRVGNILVEINPTYIHNIVGNCFGNAKDKGYHYSKSKVAIKHNFICIHIWDWNNWDEIIRLIQQPNLQMEYIGIELYYSKGKNKIKSDNPNDENLISQGYLPIYTDGFVVR